MVDLDKPVTVRLQGKEIFRGTVKRNAATIYKTIREKMDPDLTFYVELSMVGGKMGQVFK
jgi:hypothetical protein